MVLNNGDIFTGNDTGDDYEVLNRIGQGGFGDTYLVARMSDRVEFVAKGSQQDRSTCNSVSH